MKNHAIKNHRLQSSGRPRPLADRLWEKIDKAGPLWNGTPCWVWLGACNKAGYGNIGFFPEPKKLKMLLAHRVAYELVTGQPAPGKFKDGKVLDHMCHNRRCCNPAHLQVVHWLENLTIYAKKPTPLHKRDGLARPAKRPVFP